MLIELLIALFLHLMPVTVTCSQSQPYICTPR